VNKEEKFMKKILKACLCLLMVVGIVGCSGGNSTDKQEAVVKEFFESFKAGDINKALALCAKDSKGFEDFEDIESMMEEYEDETIYGTKFVEEAKEFAEEVYKTVIVSYEIKETKKVSDNYIVTVNATLKDFNEVDFDSDELNDLMEKYLDENEDELYQIAMNEGQDALMVHMFDALSKDMFDIMKAELAKAPEMKEKMEFTVVKEGDNWVISELNEYTAD